ncbi:MAG: hypothetical protein ACOC21_02285 [Halanaerobiales bacterium]
MENIDPDRIEKSINSLPGIAGSRVVVEDSEIKEVHILDTGNKNPKQLIRDIESTVMVECDIKLDHKIISIAQINDEEMMKENNTRLRINGFSKNMYQNTTEVQVELINGEQKFKGSLKGPVSKGNKLRYFSKTTLKAIEDYLGGTCSLTLNDLEVVKIGRNEAILVSVTLINEQKEEVFLGSSLVKNERELSTIKATLNSINRRISILKS